MYQDANEQLLDFNSYVEWTKGIPNREIKGFRQTIKNLLPHMDYATENPFHFTQRVWEHIYDDAEEIENVVKSVNKAIELLRD